MYCSTCGSPITQGLSFCNRCGANLRDRSQALGSATTAAFLTAITVIAIAGLGIMFGGSLVLRKEAALGGEIIGSFMLMTFLLVLVIEWLLCRQLSRLTNKSEQSSLPPAVSRTPPELYPAQQRALAEPHQSVTDNTTRTLEYAPHEPLRR
ncbi:MAG TPA: zinc ribbon domain-containing protein [Pyrinomonadaceae bacterium]|jgi:hypothetical protein